jgi:hypothetical protein
VSATPADAAHVLTRLAAATLASQASLDHLAATAAQRWDDTGIPPWAGAYASVRAGLETRLGVAPRRRAAAPSRLLMLGAGTNPAQIRLAVSLRPYERSPADARDD